MKLIANNIIWIGFSFALFSLVSIYFHKRGKILNRVIIFTTNWKESWASTLTVFSGILTQFLEPSFFPEEPNLISITAFHILQIFFPILVVIAGFTVFSLNNIFERKIGDKIYSPVWPLLFGSSLVVWAFIGELITLIVLFEQLKLADFFSKYTTSIIQYLFGVMGIIGICYVIISVGRTIERAITEDIVRDPNASFTPTKVSLP